LQESKFTQKLLKALRSHPQLHSAVIFKHNDRSTRGIPDFSISIGVRTLWFEVKVNPNKLTKIQNYFIAKLNLGASVIYSSPSGQWAAIVTPSRSIGTDVAHVTFRELIEVIVERCINA